MPRRPPPSPLRLAEGPLPPRGVCKFPLPSPPCPAAHAADPQAQARGPVPRARQFAIVPAQPKPVMLARAPLKKIVRGPWDHHHSISVPFDVGSVLRQPQPAAVMRFGMAISPV